MKRHTLKTETKVTSIKLPSEMHKKLMRSVIDDGYGMHGKSRWVNEAIQEFLQLSDYIKMVDIAEDMDKLNELANFRVPLPLLQELDGAVLAIRKEYPLMEGVRSNIIRASILQKLIRKG